jgi:membrane protease YdiL (CAAX protease family)
VAAGAYALVVLPYLHGLQTGSYERHLVINYLLLLFVPLLIVFFVFGEPPGKYGFRKGDARAAGRLFVLLFTPCLVVYVVAARMPAFQAYYPGYPPARFQAGELLFWEAAFNGFYMFCWEFFFRGFLLFALLPALGSGAVALQAALFGIMHWGKPMPEFYVSFLTGAGLGVVAWRTRSFLPTFALHAASAISFDLLVLAWGGRLGHLLLW